MYVVYTYIRTYVCVCIHTRTELWTATQTLYENSLHKSVSIRAAVQGEIRVFPRKYFFPLLTPPVVFGYQENSLSRGGGVTQTQVCQLLVEGVVSITHHLGQSVWLPVAETPAQPLTAGHTSHEQGTGHMTRSHDQGT